MSQESFKYYLFDVIDTDNHEPTTLMFRDPQSGEYQPTVMRRGQRYMITYPSALDVIDGVIKLTGTLALYRDPKIHIYLTDVDVNYANGRLVHTKAFGFTLVEHSTVTRV
jgi:hypothetical protein